MFECGACTLRCLRALAADSLAASRPHQQLLLTPGLATLPQRRRASTAVVTPTTSNDGVPYLNSAQLRHLKKQEKQERGDSVEKELLRPARPGNKRALIEEMKWLTDPLKFSDHVRYILRCNDPEKALELCRVASTKMNCVVAWNHCIDWHMKQGRSSEGVKIFNEMKKRAQFPDSYTYTILLRGLGTQSGVKTTQEERDANATKAVSIFNGMKSPNSKVQPSFIHTNAVLVATAHASQLDEFWAMVSQIPERGQGAADHITYNVILDAIRHDASRSVKGVTPEQDAARNSQVMDHGRRVWMEVVSKWRGGQVKIDEKLVGTMARLLLTGRRISHWDDVLNLVQQTMQIQRQAPSLESPERQTAHVPRISAGQEHDQAEEVEDHDFSSPTAKAFRPVTLDSSVREHRNGSSYVSPGNDILSSILEACSRMRIPKAALAYWNMFVKEYGVKPDIDNFLALLRLHYRNRASFAAMKVITEDLPFAGHQHIRLMYRLALEACLRDMKNAKSLSNARAIIDVMDSALAPTTDLKSLYLYLDLALANRDGGQKIEALDRLMRDLPAIRKVLEGGGGTSSVQREQAEVEGKELMQRMVGAIDQLTRRKIIPEQDLPAWQDRRTELTQMVGQGSEKHVPFRSESERIKWAAKEKRVVTERKISNRMAASIRTGDAARQETDEDQKWSTTRHRAPTALRATEDKRRGKTSLETAVPRTNTARHRRELRARWD